jgi:cholesterol transport system auxiliary component
MLVNLARWTGIVLLALLVSACSSLLKQEPTPPVKRYLLNLPRTDMVSKTVSNSCTSISISMPQSSSGYDTDRIAYMRENYHLEYFAYNQWVDKPARMILPVFVQLLENSGLFNNVLSANTKSIRADYRLDTELLKLVQIFNAEESSVELKLRATLYHQRERQIIATHTFSLTQPTAENTPYGTVQAANEALQTLTEELLDFIKDSAVVDKDECQAENPSTQ